MDYRKHPDRHWKHTLSAPFIYMMIVPLIIFDFFMEVYHHICFSLYGIPKVRRENHIRIDRHKLRYLTWYEKMNCAYCGYANGLMSYGTEIAGRTEKYWCGIKHAKYKGFQELAHQKGFLKYGDEKAFEKKCKLIKR